MCGIQAIGNAYEDKPGELSALPALTSPKSGKRKATDALFGNAPARPRLAARQTLRELNQATERQNTAKVVSAVASAKHSN